MNVWFPLDDATPAHWEVVSVQGNKVVVRIHFSEAVLDYQSLDSFTINLPETPDLVAPTRFIGRGRSEKICLGMEDATIGCSAIRQPH
jgi:hypothetical protein